MALEIATLPGKLSILGVAALATAALAYPLSAHFRAAQLSQTGTRESLERAIALQPHDASLHNRLGRLMFFSPGGKPGAAIAELEEATRLNPRAGHFWMDLALAHEMAGNVDAALSAVRNARAAEPKTPAILWQEANFLVRRGQMPQALAQLKALLAESPEYTVRALAFFNRVAEPGTLIAEAVPHHRAALEAAMEFVCRENIVAAAPQLWQAVSGLREPPRESYLRRFVDWLISEQQVDLARRVWADSAQRKWLPIDAAQAASGFYNAGFAAPIENFGFDWRVLPNPGASAWVESRGPAPGALSLCIQFSEDARSRFEHVMHPVAIEPNTHYSLRAALRSDRLLARGGSGLQIARTDPEAQSVNTETIRGTSHWKEVIATFTSGPGEKLVYVKLMRSALQKDEERAGGMVCLGDVRWQKLGASSAGEERR